MSEAAYDITLVWLGWGLGTAMGLFCLGAVIRGIRASM